MSNNCRFCGHEVLPADLSGTHAYKTVHKACWNEYNRRRYALKRQFLTNQAPEGPARALSQQIQNAESASEDAPSLDQDEPFAIQKAEPAAVAQEVTPEMISTSSVLPHDEQRSLASAPDSVANPEALDYPRQCLTCGAKASPLDRFCGNCGEFFGVACRMCGKVVTEWRALYCPDCGSQLPRTKMGFLVAPP